MRSISDRNTARFVVFAYTSKLALANEICLSPIHVNDTTRAALFQSCLMSISPKNTDVRPSSMRKSAAADSYDFIVCGSGSSGSVVAARLVEHPEVRVLLIGAGGSDDVPE